MPSLLHNNISQRLYPLLVRLENYKQKEEPFDVS
jgi:hypothetical protein